MKNDFTILYVEDDKDAQEELSEVFEYYFTKVLVANDGLEALEIYKKNKVDIVITDILMPNINGIELTKHIKKNDPHMPVLVITAHSENKYLMECIKLRVDGYIIKPVDLEELKNELTFRIEDIKLKYKLKYKEKLLNEYQEVIDEGTVVSKADINGNIIFANDAFSKLSGYSIDELIGSKHNIIRHEDMSDSLFENLWETILNKKVWKGRVKNKNKKGNYYWVDVVIKPILDEYNDIIEFIALRKDITLEVEYQQSLERKVKEQVEKLRQKDKVLQEQSKLAAMGEMIDAIAHQWKQPVGIIKMNTDMIGYDFEDGNLDENLMKIFQNKVFTQINHITNTLDEFRDFLRPNKNPKEFNVSKCIQSVQIIMKDELVKNNIQIDVVKNADLKIKGIENEFKHVIINLINNAKDAFIENDINNRNISIILFENKIEVIDNAGGIPLSVISHVFEANITTKDESKGSGIGLYMSKQIIDKIGGTIDVLNNKDGAVFTIKIDKNLT